MIKCSFSHPPSLAMCSYLNSCTLFISVSGQIRTTIGQAQLLIDQRFRQFSGLIDLSEVHYNFAYFHFQ